MSSPGTFLIMWQYKQTAGGRCFLRTILFPGLIRFITQNSFQNRKSTTESFKSKHIWSIDQFIIQCLFISFQSKAGTFHWLSASSSSSSSSSSSQSLSGFSIISSINMGASSPVNWYLSDSEVEKIFYSVSLSRDLRLKESFQSVPLVAKYMHNTRNGFYTNACMTNDKKSWSTDVLF